MNEAIPEFFETTIDKLVTGGAGLGRCGSLAAFVPLTAPGDRVRARVVRRKKSFVEAELVELLQPGQDRVAPPCPHYGACGGCDLQHLAGPAQRRAKAAIVSDCFQRIGRLDVGGILQGPEPAGPETGYRNRIRLHADPAGRYGLLRRGGQQVVPLDVCLQMPPQFNEIILPWLRSLPPCQQIVVRLDGGGGFLASLFGLPNRARPLKQMLRRLPDGQPPAPGCAGVLLNNLPQWGRDHLLVRAAGRTYRVGANSFFQSNQAEAEAVVAALRAWLGDGAATGRLLVDLYCGVGLFSLALAERFAHVVGVESDPHAVRDARNNAAHDKKASGRLEIVQGDVAEVLGAWNADAGVPGGLDWRDAVVVADPPRTGLGEAAVAALARLAPRDIFYLSCDPATQARDAAALAAAGYAPHRLRLFDMFPQTSHIEALLHLARA